MHEPFAAALNQMTPADAVMQLASGTVELGLDDAPEFSRWCWFADVLDSEWGLTGRLPAADHDALHQLEHVSRMCRRSRQGTLSPDEWRVAYQATETVANRSAVTGTEETYLALSAANDIALECLDELHPDFTVAVVLAFESLTACAVDSAMARLWISRAVTEWAIRTRPVVGDRHYRRTSPFRDNPSTASIVVGGYSESAVGT